LAGSSFQTISWEDDHIRILDQTRLPTEEAYLECRDLESVACAIERLAVRGAPAIGVAAAMALAFACRQVRAARPDEFMRELSELCRRLLRTRPTAVNLQWALDRMMDTAGRAAPMGTAALRDRMKQEALNILHEDIEINRTMGMNGQEVVPSPATVMTICNAGSLATAGYGTALGVVRAAVEKGKKVSVVSCETRPLLQGARLTAWELQRDNIPFTLITDNMAGSYMREKGVDLVVTGADRVAANGDAANKIGTYSLAILAKEHAVPFYVAAPASTFDLSIRSGKDIPIEERAAEEITCVRGQRIAPEAVRVWNPAFDVVPHQHIAGIITEQGILTPPYEETIQKTLG